MPRRDTGKFKRRKKVCNVDVKRQFIESSEGLPRPSSSSSPTTVSTLQTKAKKDSTSKKKVDPKVVDYEQFKDEDNGSCFDVINLQRLESLVGQVAVCAKFSGPIMLSTVTK